MRCDRCAEVFRLVGTEGTTLKPPCPACGATLLPHESAPGQADTAADAVTIRLEKSIFSGMRDDGVQNADRGSTAAEAGSPTLFQPGIMVRSILEGGKPATEDGAAVSQGAETKVLDDPISVAPPPLASDVDAYFLILGARSGRERQPLLSASTVFGREGDVTIDDASASERHFQIEAMGSGFFIRDLKSRSGTYVNGRKIRYCQLLPGDEVRIGRTVLVFRVPRDGLSVPTGLSPRRTG